MDDFSVSPRPRGQRQIAGRVRRQVQSLYLAALAADVPQNPDLLQIGVVELVRYGNFQRIPRAGVCNVRGEILPTLLFFARALDRSTDVSDSVTSLVAE